MEYNSTNYLVSDLSDRKNDRQNLGNIYNMNKGKTSVEIPLQYTKHSHVIPNPNPTVDHHTGGKWTVHCRDITRRINC